MKRLLLISILALLFAGANYAQVTFQISGTVTDIATGQPVANQAVTVMSDSSGPAFFYYNTLYTDASGQYQDLVTAPSATIITFFFFTSDCNGGGVYQTAVFSGSNNLNVDFQICTGGTTSCQAYFYVFPDSANPASGAYQFYSASTGNPATYAWSFGDGATSSLQDPTHTYAGTGLYYVCLTITLPNCTDTYCDSVYIGTPPCYNYFSYSIQGLNCDFTAYPFNGTPPYTYSWDFGDGTTGVGVSPTHAYAASGYYAVTLVTTDGNACTATSVQYIYAGSTPAFLYGQVTANGVGIDYGKISLFVSNPATGALYLTDTTQIDSSGYYYFSNVVPGTYYILAAPTPSSSYFTTYAPTYYSSAIFWASATPIVLGTAANPYDIALASLVGPSPGSGGISGTITEGAKLMTQGPAVPNIEIMLLNMSNQALAMVYSDAAGQFSFQNLAMGTYKVYAEVAGLPTVPYMVTLSANNPNSSNVGLVMTPNGISTGLSENPVVSEISILNVYPNPARDVVTIAVESAKPAVVTAELFDLTGKRVMTQSMSISSGKSAYTLEVANLLPGFYTLSLVSDKGLKTMQKLTLIP